MRLKLRRNLHQSEVHQVLQMFQVLVSPPDLADEVEDELHCITPGDFNINTCYK